MQAAVYLPSSPTTPHRLSYTSPTSYAHPPLRSSPLASPNSSPTADAHARRRSQYKANAFSSPVSRRTSDAYAQQRRRSNGGFVQGSSTQATSAPTEEPPRKAFLRERLQARCLERAQKKRERAIAQGRRHMSSEPSSDGLEDMMDEDDEDEENMLNDEVRRSCRCHSCRAGRLTHCAAVVSSYRRERETQGATWLQALVRLRRWLVIRP